MKTNSNTMIMKKSPWPMMMMTSMSNMFMTMTWSMESKMNTMNLLTIIMTSWTMIKWNQNSNMEKFISGMNTTNNQLNLKTTMINVITSEMAFFMTFFYLNFSNSYFYNINMNMKMNNKMFKLNSVLAMNNLIMLLTSSMTMMMYINLNKKNMNPNKFMMKTIILSMYFMTMQMMEFKYMNMNMMNSFKMSNFFTLTSFHLMHVLLGTMMMTILTINKTKMMNNKTKMTLTCWYWHFVDMIWIFIFMLIY